MYRLGHLVDGEWIAHSHVPVFESGDRIVAGVPGGDPMIFRRLIECLEPPYQLLYVLHTPRGEAQPGRYQSQNLTWSEVDAFLIKYGSYLAADARFDLWGHSSTEGAIVVWDRHNQIIAYGPLEKFESALRSLGFTAGFSPIPVPHEHYYRSEWDGAARAVMGEFEWSRTPLLPEDEQ